jgi:uncharacterized protein (TIGR00369 family)
MGGPPQGALLEENEGKDQRHKMKLVANDNCFVCGKGNAGGLQLDFEIDKEKQTLKTTFVPGPVFQGYDGILHGGIISTLLDEAMAKLAYELGMNAVTAALEVRFKRPAQILQRLMVYGELVEVNAKLIKAKARVSNEDGTILATGTSTLVRTSGVGRP